MDVVFMGDGYTLAEKDKFFNDITGLTNDMFTGDTFAQYLPLFNIWAAYVPSAVSGIGVSNKPRDTAFRLYREGKELRAIFTGNKQVARDVCFSIDSKVCDFPSLIANDDLYGERGGEFVISTSSATSGTIVLRHEMGHVFGDVGEEYDGGELYIGPNSSPTTDVTLKHWLTDPTRLVEEQAAQLYQKHMWVDLEQSSSYTIEFTSTGTFKRWYMLFSVSGADADDSISVTLDGKPLAWKSNGLKDRSFYQFSSSTSGFSAGKHQLVVKSTRAPSGPVAKMLCNAAIYEYADESGYQLDDPTAIGIYPTYDINKRKTYRPNNERCLMRNMTSTHFCKVCQENLWLNFLPRLKLVDAVQISGRTVSLKLIPLAQFRLPTDKFIKDDPAVALAEKYSVKWLKSDGQELVQFRDKFTGVDFTGQPAGTYKAVVTFTTPNIRVDKRNWSTSEQQFTPKPSLAFPRKMFFMDSVLYPFGSIPALCYVTIAVYYLCTGDSPFYAQGLTFIYSFLPLMLARWLLNLLANRAVDNNDVWRAQQTWFSYAFITMLAIGEALQARLTGKESSWTNTGAGQKTSWFEIPNVLMFFTLGLSQFVAFLRFMQYENATTPWNYFSAMFFGFWIMAQYYPMVKMSITEYCGWDHTSATFQANVFGSLLLVLIVVFVQLWQLYFSANLAVARGETSSASAT